MCLHICVHVYVYIINVTFLKVDKYFEIKIKAESRCLLGDTLFCLDKARFLTISTRVFNVSLVLLVTVLQNMSTLYDHDHRSV